MCGALDIGRFYRHGTTALYPFVALTQAAESTHSISTLRASQEKVHSPLKEGVP